MGSCIRELILIILESLQTTCSLSATYQISPLQSILSLKWSPPKFFLFLTLNLSTFISLLLPRPLTPINLSQACQFNVIKTMLSSFHDEKHKQASKIAKFLSLELKILHSSPIFHSDFPPFLSPLLQSNQAIHCPCNKLYSLFIRGSPSNTITFFSFSSIKPSIARVWNVSLWCHTQYNQEIDQTF